MAAAPFPRLCTWFLLGSVLALPAQELPQQGGSGSLEKEAAALIENLPDLQDVPLDAGPLKLLPSVQKAEARLQYAQRKMERWAKLARQGVVSRVEAEGAMLDYHLAVLVCEQARLAQLVADAAALQSAPDGAPAAPAQPAAKSPALLEAEAKVTTAQAELSRLRLQTARENLTRFRKLYAARLVTKAQVQRLESAIATLEKQQGGGESIIPPVPPAPSVPSAERRPGIP